MISFGMNIVHLIGVIVVNGTVKCLWWRIVGKKEQERRKRHENEEEERRIVREMWGEYVENMEFDSGEEKH